MFLRKKQLSRALLLQIQRMKDLRIAVISGEIWYAIKLKILFVDSFIQ